ncbi:MAG TPA: hypothetical protein VHF50_08575 [Solirubrobacterales bacterium]|nr:hypothetical protein [Solirubrobacterales bacterium]
MEGFLDAVAIQDREGALNHVAEAPELIGLTIQRVGSPPPEQGWGHQTPRQAYRQAAAAVAGPAAPRLLAAATGPIAPFEADSRYETPPGDKAGVEIVVIAGQRSLSGKVGLHCASGRIYVGALSLQQGLRKQQHCGRQITRRLRRPAVCEI